MRDMHRRLERRLARAALSDDDARRVLDTHARALLHRADVLRDDTHRDLLHPSRTLLILLDDCDAADADVLEAAASFESEFVALRIPSPNALVQEVPRPDAEDDLLEALVVASPELRLIALAERLDHARHLHLGPPERWGTFHAQVCGTYRPVAHRTHPRLARRYDWWCAMFDRRFLSARTRD